MATEIKTAKISDHKLVVLDGLEILVHRYNVACSEMLSVDVYERERWDQLCCEGKSCQHRMPKHTTIFHMDEKHPEELRGWWGAVGTEILPKHIEAMEGGSHGRIVAVEELRKAARDRADRAIAATFPEVLSREIVRMGSYSAWYK